MKRQTITMSVKDARLEKANEGERKYTFRTVDIDQIQAYGNIRTGDVANDDLVASIGALGIINPLTVVQDTGMASYYRLIAGFRRFAAAKKLGLKKVPCHVVDKDESLGELALSENVSRMDMAPYDECIAVRNLVNLKKTPAQIAKRFGRTVRWVLTRKKLADAGDKVLEKVKEGKIPLSAAARLAELPDNVFKEELEDIGYTISDWEVRNILERNRMDLEKAPFDHSRCLKCDKCSACQKDLFDEDPKAYCLDSDCWEKKVKKAAKDKAEAFRKDGYEAKVGYEFETDEEIGSWEKDLLKQAEESRIKKRIIVNPETCKEKWYYSKKDLPGYHEETEEEREEARKKRDAEHLADRIRTDMHKDTLKKRIAEKIRMGGDKDDIIALLVFQCADFDDLIDKDEYDALGVEHNDEDMYCAGIKDISDHARPCDFLDAVKGSVKHILDNTYDIDILKKMYSIITFADPEDAKPTEKQVQAEIKRRKKANEKDGDPKEAEPVDDEVEDELSRKNAGSEHDEEEEGDDE